MKKKIIISVLSAFVLQMGISCVSFADELYYYENQAPCMANFYDTKKVFSGDTTNSSVSADGTINVNSALTSETRYLFKTCSWSGNNMYVTMPWTCDNYENSLLSIDVTLKDTSSKTIGVSLGMARESYMGSVNYNTGSRAYSQKTVQLSDYLDNTLQKQTVEIPLEAFGNGMVAAVWDGGGFTYPVYRWEDVLSQHKYALTQYGADKKTIECINGVEFILPKGCENGVKIENIKVVPREAKGIEGDGVKVGSVDASGENKVGFGIFDSFGNEVTSITPNMTVKIKGLSINNSELENSFMTMLAVYKNDVLLKLIPSAVTVPTGISDFLCDEYTLGSDTDGITLRGYVWSDFADRQAFIDFTEISAQ